MVNKEKYGVLSRPGLVPFIWIHHPHTPIPLVELPKSSSKNIILDAIEYHTPKLLYSGILGKIEELNTEVKTWDEFTRILGASMRSRKGSISGPSGKGKRKADEVDTADGLNGISSRNGNERMGLSIIIKHAERLRTVLGPGWTVITRLAEITGLDVTVALCSSFTWDELRPPRGDAPEPIILDIAPPSNDDIRQSLSSASSHPLWTRFLDLIIPVLGHLIPSPTVELEYIAESLWPIYTSSLPPHSEQILLNKPYSDQSNPPPPLQISIKLLTDLKHSMAVPLAIVSEELLTRRIGPTNFSRVLENTNKVALTPRHTGQQGAMGSGIGGGAFGADLAICSKFLIVAGYCASYNPPKSDQRLFGRVGVDGKRRKGGGGMRPAGYGKMRIGKIPQRLLGPKPFTLDRFLALFSALYAEHAPRPEDLLPALEYDDTDEEEEQDWTLSVVDIAQKRAEKVRAKEKEMDERWDEEVEHLSMSTGLWSLIPELESQGLFKRMSPPDRLDNITMRCEVDYEEVKSVAKELRLTLDEYLYEATS